MSNVAKKYTVLLLVLTHFLSSFSPSPQTDSVHKRAKTQPRPALSGPTLSYATEHFIIHYTLDGEDAVSSKDENSNHLSDYVDAVAEALEFSWQQEVEQFGWRPPLPDKGEGGDMRFDVYLHNQYDLFGYVETYGGYVGDNPTTAAQEDSTAYGYLGLDNDYNPDELGEDLLPLDAMRTTVAHELHHAIQAAYDDRDPYEWLYEASAVWVENEVYPDIGEAKRYLTDYMAAPDLCPLSIGRDDQDVRWYGGWILLQYISEHYGGPSTIQRLWEQMAVLDGLPALEAVLAEQGTTLADVLVNFAIANLIKADCPLNTPYCYAQGSEYLRPHIEGMVRVDPGEVDTLTPKDGVQQLGTDFIRLKSKSPVLVDFQGSKNAEWEVRLVGIDDEQVTVTPVTDNSPALIDPSQLDRLYLVVVNTTPVETEADCGYHNYTLTVADALVEERIETPPVPADPGRYIPPGYDELNNSYLLDGGIPIKTEEVPFPPLYPDYLPVGYTFTRLLSYPIADLGEFEQDYAPGGEPVIALEYTGTNSEMYISIFQSPSPYESVAEWVTAQGYYANDVRLVNNKPVYLLDLSDKIGPFSTATLIHQDLFVVIDGTFDWIEMQHVVAGFMANNP
jgi:hypothetical protein